MFALPAVAGKLQCNDEGAEGIPVDTDEHVLLLVTASDKNHVQRSTKPVQPINLQGKPFSPKSKAFPPLAAYVGCLVGAWTS